MIGRFKRILTNEYESESHKTLDEAAQQHDARVFAKVRVADVLNINQSGLSQAEFSYALRAHFDFVITYSDSQPVFAVEFDGAQHSADPEVIHRDWMKDAICSRFGFPLLRIDSGFMRRIGRFTLLSYLVEVWFLNEAFNEAQGRDEVPYDEVFHPGFIIADSLDLNDKKWFPYDLARDAKRVIVPMMDRGECDLYSNPPYLDGIDPAGYAVALAIFKVQTGLIIGLGRCRLYRFAPLSPRVLAHDLAWVNAGDQIQRYKQGVLTPDTEESLTAWKRRIESWKSYR